MKELAGRLASAEAHIAQLNVKQARFAAEEQQLRMRDSVLAAGAEQAHLSTALHSI